VLSALDPPQSIPKWFHSHLPSLAWRGCDSANTGEPIMWQVHPSSNIAKPGFAGMSAACVFPRYSTRLFKETLAVIGLVLFLMAVVMPLTLVTPSSFSNSPALTACSTPDHMASLQTPCWH
jgi:hypothetical protein